MDIIFDVDGTLMNIDHRRKFVENRPKDFKAFRNATEHDTPNKDVFAIAQAMRLAGHRIIIASGRNKSQRDITEAQMIAGGIVPEAFYMRSDKDYRADYIVKREMLDKIRADGYDPVLVFDDRTSVVNMWREAGLRAVQVAPGDF